MSETKHCHNSFPASASVVRASFAVVSMSDFSARSPPHIMKRGSDADDPRAPALTSVSRAVSGETFRILTRASTSAIDVSARDASGKTFVGRLDLQRAPFERFGEFARAALGDPRRERVERAFTFTFECAEENGDEYELVWRFREAEAEATLDDGAEFATTRAKTANDGKNYGAVRTGVCGMRRVESDDAFCDGGFAYEALGEALEMEARRRFNAERDGKRAIEARERANENCETALREMDALKERLAQNFLSLLNEKKKGMRKMAEELEAARAENDELKADLASARLEHSKPDVDGFVAVKGERSVDADVDEDRDESEDEYNTDDETERTRRRGRKRDASQPSQRKSQPSQSQPSQKRARNATAKKKSFLADTLALLDAD